jgi:hypothetical protein
MVQLLILEDQIDLEQALERKGFHLEERNSWRKEKRSEGGWEGKEGNQRVCLPPQACTKEKGAGERREVFRYFSPSPFS